MNAQRHVYYILNEDHLAVPCELLEWAQWFESADRRVAEDRIGAFRISTVFLGLDHAFGEQGDPVLFETMVFGPDGESADMDRYSTWSDAQAGHARIKSEVESRAATS